MPPVPSPFPLAPHGHPHHQQQLQQQQQQQSHPLYPALHLYPLNDSFVPKQIALPPSNQHVKIGRQTNAKTVPGERNGYFDSKVLSRQHAEVWEESNKIFIRDVKSSNGTFINGERLSQEGIESDPFELKTDDTVEFGIDIVGEDNKTIIHHKVAAKVFCVLGPEDLQSLPLHASHAFQNRRPTIQGGLQQNSAQGNALGGMGAPRGTKSGLTFEHILSRLQNELQKSRETGQELNSLNGVMTDIHDTMGGALPSNLPPYPAVLPPVRPPQESQAALQGPAPASAASPTAPLDPSASATLTALQTQMNETQANIVAQLDKIRQLEKLMSDHEMFKREIVFMREQMEERKREVEILLTQRRSEESANGAFSRRRDEPIQQVDEESEDDDDDARSVSTAVPEERYSDDEGDEEERRRHRDELGRPRTPEPTGHLEEEYEEEQRRQQQQESASAELATSTLTSTAITSGPPPPPYPDLSEMYNQNAILTNRLESLVAQLDSAMELSRTLESQTRMAHETIASLEAKVGTLEAFVEEQRAKQLQPPVEEEKPVPEVTIAQGKWDEWRERVEGRWKSERETWQSEQSRLADAVKEYERRTVDLERKEEERREKEEREEERRKVVGFDEADEQFSSSSGVDEKPDVFGEKSAKPKMVNGITKHRKVRRRKNLNVNTAAATNGNGHGKHHGLVNGTANGVLPPSPLASPTSSISGSSAPTHSKSPSSSPASSLRSSSYDSGKQAINGKVPLPLSPPNTSPRSRPESLALDDEDTSSLGLTASKANSSIGSMVGSSGTSGMPLTKRHTTSDIPMQVISAAGIVVIGVAAWAVVNRMKD